MLNKKVSDIMSVGNDIPSVKETDVFRTVLEVLAEKNLGGIAVINEEAALKGIVSDGDIKRIFLETDDTLPKLFLKDVKEMMVENPRSIHKDVSVKEALIAMRNPEPIWCMPVVDDANKLVGFFHMTSILKELTSDLFGDASQ